MMARPPPLMVLRVHEIRAPRGHSGACVGYERGQWRAEALASHAMEWLPEFALKYGELSGVRADTAVRMLRKAAQAVYSTDKYGRRGEFGELILHALIRQTFDSTPAISKIYYKDSANDTVKGFDAVHCVADGDDLQLWLGESKFYTDIRAAIRDVAHELEVHAGTDYLRQEFSLIVNKLDPDWPHIDKLKKLLDQNTSLDKIFASTHFAILLTYDSDVIKAHRETNASYEQRFRDEISNHSATFAEATRALGTLHLHLFLLPLEDKARLVELLHARLRGAQSI